MQEAVNRLVKLYRSASPNQIAAGHRWYRDAKELTIELARHSNYSEEQVAGVIAVLSPRLRWPKNVRAAGAAVAGSPKPAGIMGPSWDKAQAVLQGDMTAIRGQKVTAFWHNILGDPNKVTVDSWATRAAMGWNKNGKWLSGGKNEDFVGHYTESHYDEIQDAYLAAATICGVAPADFQAVCWVVIRGRS